MTYEEVLALRHEKIIHERELAERRKKEQNDAIMNLLVKNNIPDKIERILVERGSCLISLEPLWQSENSRYGIYIDEDIRDYEGLSKVEIFKVIIEIFEKRGYRICDNSDIITCTAKICFHSEDQV